MKKISVITLIAAILTSSLCTVALAAFHREAGIAVYRGEEWHFDIEEKDYPYITVIPQDRQEPQAYGNGYAGKAEPEEKEYDVILLGQ